MPAEEVPGELWAKVTQSPRPTRVVSFPRVDPATSEPIGEVMLIVLSQGEITSAQADASKYTHTLLGEMKLAPGQTVVGADELYQNALAVEMVQRFTRYPDSINRRFFPTPKSVRDGLSGDETAVLFDAYCTLQAECSPAFRSLDEAEVKAWMGRVAASASAGPLAGFSRAQLLLLISSTAAQLVALPMGRSWLGLPPDEQQAQPSSDEPT